MTGDAGRAPVGRAWPAPAVALVGGLLVLVPCAGGVDGLGLALLVAGGSAALWAAVRRAGAATLTAVLAMAHVAEAAHRPTGMVLAETAVLAAYLALVHGVESGVFAAGWQARRPALPALGRVWVVAACGALATLVIGAGWSTGAAARTAAATVGVAAIAALLALAVRSGRRR
jgi:hypothetical protein